MREKLFALAVAIGITALGSALLSPGLRSIDLPAESATPASRARSYEQLMATRAGTVAAAKSLREALRIAPESERGPALAALERQINLVAEARLHLWKKRRGMPDWAASEFVMRVGEACDRKERALRAAIRDGRRTPPPPSASWRGEWQGFQTKLREYAAAAGAVRRLCPLR